MGLIKNKYIDEINAQPERFEDEEFFYEKSQKQVKPKTINENGKDSKNHKDSIQE